MKYKREIGIQLFLFLVLLLSSSALAVHTGYGDFTLSNVLSTFIGAITFARGHFEILALSIMLLLLYNFVIGTAWTAIKTIKHRKKISIRKAVTSPLALLVAFTLLLYGIVSTGRVVERRKTEKLLESLFRGSTGTDNLSYETRLSPPLDDSIFSQKIHELKIKKDYSLIRLEDGSILLAVINKNKKRIVLAKN